MDKGFAGGPGEEHPDDDGVSDIKQGVTLLGQVLDVLAERLLMLMLAAPKVPGVARVFVCALEFPHEQLLEVRPILDPASRKVLEPCQRRIGRE